MEFIARIHQHGGVYAPSIELGIRPIFAMFDVSMLYTTQHLICRYPVTGSVSRSFSAYSSLGLEVTLELAEEW